MSTLKHRVADEKKKKKKKNNNSQKTSKLVKVLTEIGLRSTGNNLCTQRGVSSSK